MSKMLVTALALLSLLAPAAPQSTLEAFGALAVGTWEGDDARQVLEWGVGRKLIHSRSYFPTEEGWRLVSEGIWYEDPAAGVVRGTVIAIDMPVERFEYTSRLGEGEIVHDLQAHGLAGGKYVETWTFDGDGFTWNLESVDDDGDRQPMMGGRYRRVPDGS